MSNNVEKISELIAKVAELKRTIELKSLLEALGFFALTQLYEAAFKTEDTLNKATELAAGGFILNLKQLTITRNRINTRTRFSFVSI